jgi:hypothetical protein
MKMISIALFVLVPAALYAAEPAKPPATVWCIQPVPAKNNQGWAPPSKVWKGKEGARFSTPSLLDLRSIDRLKQAVVGDTVRYLFADGKVNTDVRILNAVLLDRALSPSNGSVVPGRFVALYVEHDTSTQATQWGLGYLGDKQGRTYGFSGVAAPKEVQRLFPSVAPFSNGNPRIGVFRSLVLYQIRDDTKEITAQFGVCSITHSASGRPLKEPVYVYLHVRLDLDKAEPLALKETPAPTGSAPPPPLPRPLGGAPAK